jgi:hypothetical protein
MLRGFFAVAAAVFLTASVAHADIFVGTATFTDKNAGGAADFTAPTANIDLTTLLNAGNNLTIQDFLVVSTTDTASHTNTQNDSLGLTFQFTSPSPRIVPETGTGTETVTISGNTDIATGAITWANGGNVSVTFADKSVLDIVLSFDPLDSIFVTTDGNQDLTLAYNATFTLGPNATTAVPEPGTLALFGAGLTILGVVRRKRKAR